MMEVSEGVFYLVDNPLRRSFNPWWYQVGNSDFAEIVWGKNRRKQSPIFINKWSVKVSSMSCLDLKFFSKIKSFKWAKSVIPKINV